jgi:hypothetical protein
VLLRSALRATGSCSESGGSNPLGCGGFSPTGALSSPARSRVRPRPCSTAKERTFHVRGGNPFGEDKCSSSEVTTDEARALDRILGAAHFEKTAGEYGFRYESEAPAPIGTNVQIWFQPLFPNGEWGAKLPG